MPLRTDVGKRRRLILSLSTGWQLLLNIFYVCHGLYRNEVESLDATLIGAQVAFQPYWREEDSSRLLFSLSFN